MEKRCGKREWRRRLLSGLLVAVLAATGAFALPLLDKDNNAYALSYTWTSPDGQLKGTRQDGGVGAGIYITEYLGSGTAVTIDDTYPNSDGSGSYPVVSVDLDYEGLTSLDVSAATSLKYLKCSNNKLSSVNMSGCTALEVLNCDVNKLTSLNTTQNTALRVLNCDKNDLTTLNISNNPALEYLYCMRNRITDAALLSSLKSKFGAKGDIEPQGQRIRLSGVSLSFGNSGKLTSTVSSDGLTFTFDNTNGEDIQKYINKAISSDSPKLYFIADTKRFWFDETGTDSAAGDQSSGVAMTLPTGDLISGYRCFHAKFRDREWGEVTTVTVRIKELKNQNGTGGGNNGGGTGPAGGWGGMTGSPPTSGKLTDSSGNAVTVSIAGIPDSAWTGKQVKPVPAVTASGNARDARSYAFGYAVRFASRASSGQKGKKLAKGTDYTVSYGANKNIGKGTLTIKGAGKYKGSITAPFKIVPKAPTGVKLTAAAKALKVKWTKPAKFKNQQIAGYEVQYRYKDGSKWTAWNTKSFKISYKATAKAVTKTLKGLKAGKQYQVQVRAYKKVSGTNYCSAWTKVKAKKTK